MFMLTLSSGESAFVRCTHCGHLNLMVTNEKETNVTLQFNTKNDHLDAQCLFCKRQYFWTPSSVAIVKPSHNAS